MNETESRRALYYPDRKDRALKASVVAMTIITIILIALCGWLRS